MKILITHPSGNRNFQYLAKSICFKKKHNIIFTSLNINTDNIYIKLLPKKFKNLLEARNYSKFKSTVQSLQPIYELIRLFLSISVLLKMIPEFSFAGKRLTVDFLPECSPKPVKLSLVDSVF